MKILKHIKPWMVTIFLLTACLYSALMLMVKGKFDCYCTYDIINGGIVVDTVTYIHTAGSNLKSKTCWASCSSYGQSLGGSWFKAKNYRAGDTETGWFFNQVPRRKR